jgi:hypothetical protein
MQRNETNARATARKVRAPAEEIRHVLPLTLVGGATTFTLSDTNG